MFILPSLLSLYHPLLSPITGGAHSVRRGNVQYCKARQGNPRTTAQPRHRNPPGQGYLTGVLTLPYSGFQGQRSLLTRPVTLPGSGQGTLQGRIEVETV
jgi:hypothetical protein